MYRLLKAYDLVTSPAFILLSACAKFPHPIKRVNELWQTDFTQFKVVGWYYLSTVIFEAWQPQPLRCTEEWISASLTS